MTSEAESTVFMTGATGFLGHFVVRDLLAAGRRVVAIVRPPLKDSRQRLANMLAPLGPALEESEKAGRLVVVEGSLPDALPEPTWGRTNTIVHCAASLQLYANGNGDPATTNIEGTRAVMDWATRHGVAEIHAVSTAYTCGWKTGRIPEAFHDPAPEFQTDYERTKWQAERMLAEWAAGGDRSLTVYRPSFLVGDSTTGRTTQYSGFYQFARVIGMLKQRFFDPTNGKLTHVPLRIPGRPDERQNLVPVDFCSRIIAEVIQRPEFHGRIYHLTNPEPPTNDLIKSCYEEFFGLCGGYFASPDEVVGQYTPAESFLWNDYPIITPRIAHNPEFDVTHTREVMSAADVLFPQLDRERILRLLDFAETDAWGRRGGNNGG